MNERSNIRKLLKEQFLKEQPIGITLIEEDKTIEGSIKKEEDKK